MTFATCRNAFFYVITKRDDSIYLILHFYVKYCKLIMKLRLVELGKCLILSVEKNCYEYLFFSFDCYKIENSLNCSYLKLFLLGFLNSD